MPIDYPNARIGAECPRCGAKIRVSSAKRLLGGKLKARVMVECDCYAGCHRPTRLERLDLIRRATIKLVG